MVLGKDGKKRCFGTDDKPYLLQYHDKEWGTPSHDDKHLFEMLVLEGAQAGLSWQTVLNKRQSYRKAFFNFDPVKVAAMSDNKLETLMQDSDIIRNRKKIWATRQNARVFLEIQKQYGTFESYAWSFVHGKPIVHRLHIFADLPSTIQESEALSKDLKKHGMSFVGPKIIYAFMQAVGLVNDHLLGCWRVKKS